MEVFTPHYNFHDLFFFIVLGFVEIFLNFFGKFCQISVFNAVCGKDITLICWYYVNHICYRLFTELIAFRWYFFLKKCSDVSNCIGTLWRLVWLFHVELLLSSIFLVIFLVGDVRYVWKLLITPDRKGCCTSLIEKIITEKEHGPVDWPNALICDSLHLN